MPVSSVLLDLPSQPVIWKCELKIEDPNKAFPFTKLLGAAARLFLVCRFHRSDRRRFHPPVNGWDSRSRRRDGVHVTPLGAPRYCRL